MADDKSQSTQNNDDDLLENAIPIEDLADLEEDDDDASSAVSNEDDIEAIEMEGSLELGEGEVDRSADKIKMFGSQKAHTEAWNRKPNATGAGAIHVKTFVSKLRLDAIEHMDQLINEWLDEHPEYEVKFVTSQVGELTGKTKEVALFMSVWV